MFKSCSKRIRDLVVASELRKGMNESLFRQLNDRLEQRALDRGPEEALEIVCECAREECTARIPVLIAEYEAVRSEPTKFIVLTGHSDETVERVVDSSDGYEIVEKLGEAALVAEVENPRDG
jgi:hypothetical protein